MKKIFNKFIALSLYIALLFFVYHYSQVFAAEPPVNQMIRVSPVILDIQLTPGKTTNYDIKIDNILSVPLPVTANVEGYDTTNEEGSPNFNTSQTTSPLTSWISIPQPDMIIPAGGTKIMNLSVKVPPQVAVGGYYATIFLTPTLPTTNDNARIIPKIGIIVLANLGVFEDQFNPKAEITSFSFGQYIYDRSPVSWLFRVKNISLSHFSAKPTLTLNPLIGKKLVIDMPEKIILPGKIRRFEQSSQNNLPIGFYFAKLSVYTGGGNEISQKSWVIIFPWQKTLLFIITIGVILFIIFRWRNIVRAIRILFSNRA